MIRKLNNCLVFVFLVLLSACSGNGVREGGDGVNKGVPFYNVNTSVEKDFNHAVSLMQSGDYSLAVTILKTVVTREKRLPAPFVNLAMAYNKLDEKHLAEDNFVIALKLDRTNAEANNELGLIYRKAGKFKAAKTAYENAIEANPAYLPAKKNLGILCDLYLHDFDCAYEQFSAYLKVRPNDKTMAIWVADVERRQ
jgi:Tfp pilus assembly protein PilF